MKIDAAIEKYAYKIRDKYCIDAAIDLNSFSSPSVVNHDIRALRDYDVSTSIYQEENNILYVTFRSTDQTFISFFLELEDGDLADYDYYGKYLLPVGHDKKDKFVKQKVEKKYKFQLHADHDDPYIAAITPEVQVIASVQNFEYLIDRHKNYKQVTPSDVKLKFYIVDHNSNEEELEVDNFYDFYEKYGELYNIIPRTRNSDSYNFKAAISKLAKEVARSNESKNAKDFKEQVCITPKSMTIIEALNYLKKK